MRELPILYSTPMVEALLDDRKRMTRRTAGLETINMLPDNWQITNIKGNIFYFRDTINIMNLPDFEVISRYQVGDRLWVKETYYASGYWVQSGEKTKSGKYKKQFIDNTLNVIDQIYLYEDNKPKSFRIDRDTVRGGWFKRPSLFMPKKAARICLECTGARCERLQQITQADAIAEGILPLQMSASQLIEQGQKYFDYSKPKQFFSEGLDPFWSFNSLWCSINGGDSWDLNPWVFVYEFKRIDKP